MFSNCLWTILPSKCATLRVIIVGSIEDRLIRCVLVQLKISSFIELQREPNHAILFL